MGLPGTDSADVGRIWLKLITSPSSLQPALILFWCWINAPTLKYPSQGIATSGQGFSWTHFPFLCQEKDHCNGQKSKFSKLPTLTNAILTWNHNLHATQMFFKGCTATFTVVTSTLSMKLLLAYLHKPSTQLFWLAKRSLPIMAVSGRHFLNKKLVLIDCLVK